jgi:hypothetical protein
MNFEVRPESALIVPILVAGIEKLRALLVATGETPVPGT